MWYISFVIHVVSKGRLEDDEVGLDIMPLIWDAQPQVRERAIEFAFQDIFAEHMQGQTQYNIRTNTKN